MASSGEAAPMIEHRRDAEERSSGTGASRLAGPAQRVVAR